jgi:hypothetical protein
MLNECVVAVNAWCKCRQCVGLDIRQHLGLGIDILAPIGNHDSFFKFISKFPA